MEDNSLGSHQCMWIYVKWYLYYKFLYILYLIFSVNFLDMYDIRLYLCKNRYFKKYLIRIISIVYNNILGLLIIYPLFIYNF